MADFNYKRKAHSFAAFALSFVSYRFLLNIFKVLVIAEKRVFLLCVSLGLKRAGLGCVVNSWKPSLLAVIEPFGSPPASGALPL